jgi:hypothetical protein
MKKEEKSTLGFMVLTSSPMPIFFIAAIVNTSQMIRLITVLVPVILGMYLWLANSVEKKN